MILRAYTIIHTLISLIGIFTGLIVLFGLLADKRLDGWTKWFLITTVLTSVTGFFFPFHGFTPAIALGIMSLIVLAVAIFARYPRQLAGHWRWIYVVTAVIALYFNVFVLVVQTFEKIPALHAMAPTQTEAIQANSAHCAGDFRFPRHRRRNQVPPRTGSGRLIGFARVHQVVEIPSGRTDMSDATVAMPLTLVERIDQIFPTLTAAQIARIGARGRKRQLQPSEILQEVGAQVRFFLVTAGKIDIFSVLGPNESLVATLGAGQFTGEVNLLSGRRGLTRIRASEAGEVIELDREQLLDLLQTDSELSDIVMRAFILRRVELIAQGVGDAVLVGSSYSSDTLRIKEFLIRNGHPHAYIDLDRDNDVQHFLDRFHVGMADIPVVICRGEICAAQSNKSANRRLPWLQ